MQVAGLEADSHQYHVMGCGCSKQQLKPLHHNAHSYFSSFYSLCALSPEDTKIQDSQTYSEGSLLHNTDPSLPCSLNVMVIVTQWQWNSRPLCPVEPLIHCTKTPLPLTMYSHLIQDGENSGHNTLFSLFCVSLPTSCLLFFPVSI